MLTDLKKISEHPVPVFEFQHGEVRFEIALVGEFLHELRDGKPGKRYKCLQNAPRFKIYRNFVRTVTPGYFVFVLDKQQNRLMYDAEHPNSTIEMHKNVRDYENTLEKASESTFGGTNHGQNG